MQRQSIIVFIQGERIETYGNLKSVANLKDLNTGHFQGLNSRFG